MAAGDAFPTRADLDAAALVLDEIAARLAEAMTRWPTGPNSKSKRKAARALLKEAWFAAEGLRAADEGPASAPALIALRTARDLELTLSAAVGEDPHASLTRPASAIRPASPSSHLTPPSNPMRLDWPIRYDLDRIERLGGPGRAAAALAGRVDDVAAEIEARARAAAGLAPPDTPRKIEPDVDMDVMELARAQKKKGGPGGAGGVR